MSRKYDSRTTTFSPEGRLYQVEYAMEAISHAGLTFGIMSSNGIVLTAIRRKLSGTLEEPQQYSMEKIFKIDNHLAISVAGLTADANILIDEARTKSLSHWMTFSSSIPIELLVQRIGNLKQGFTQMGGLRPFGVSLLYAGYDTALGFQLYHSDPSGNYSSWKATAVGAQSQTAQSFLKNEYVEELTIESAKKLAFKTLKHVFIGENDQVSEEQEEELNELDQDKLVELLSSVEMSILKIGESGKPVIELLSTEELSKEFTHQMSLMSVVH